MGLYNYRPKAILDLPMTFADHDPVNTRTLNRGRGGAALDAVWTAGATAPTKLTTREGYSFDGGDYMTIAAMPALTTSFSVGMVVSATASATGAYVGGNGLIAACNWLIYTVDGRYTFYVGTNGGANGSGVPAGQGNSGTHTLVGVCEPGRVQLYVNGIAMNPAATPVAPAAGASFVDIGRRPGVASNYFTGSVSHLIVIDGITLSPLQVQDYHNAAIRHLHRI